MSDEYQIETLEAQECWRLLDESRFGRIALAVQEDPDIYPVNFLVDDGKILMRSGPGTKLAEISVNHMVAVEADEVTDTVAWSVIAKGEARIVQSFSETYELDEKHLEAWVPSDKPIYIEISVTELSGRRFTR